MDTRTQRRRTAVSDEWYTPQWVIDMLGPFDCDPCAAPQAARPFATAPLCWTKEDDGLQKDWQGVVWMNPPYSAAPLRRFCEKMAAHGQGIALLVNRQDNTLWQEVIFPTATSMIFMRHRIRFISPDGKRSHPFMGSCLVAWGAESDRRLRRCGIEGKYVVLNAPPYKDGEQDTTPEDYLLMKSGAAGTFNSQQSVVSIADAYRALRMRNEFV